MAPALGLLRPHASDHTHHRVKLGSFIDGLPDPPAAINWTKPIGRGWGEYGNASRGIPNCGVVGPANAIRLWSAHTTPDPGIVSQGEVDAAYAALDPTGVSGVVLSDALALWVSTGIGGHKLSGFAEVEHADDIAIRQALMLFGCVVVGLRLPRAVEPYGNWVDVPGDATPSSEYIGAAGLTGDWVPGSWGGHCALIVRCDIDGFGVVTWGEDRRMSSRFGATYIDEAWAPVSKDWIEFYGRSPSGLDIDGLLAACVALEDRT